MSTNEEKRVHLYSANPTNPSSVTSDTPLETLNLNWREKELPERERTKHVHRLHPYLGKFVPQIVEIFLRKYFQPGQTVLDPFVGSGTTLVQANELGINAIGYDISAFNVILCRAKTANYNLDRVRQEVLDVLQKTTQAAQSSLTDLPLFQNMTVEQLDEEIVADDYLKRWFAPQALRQLVTYRNHIFHGNYEYQDVLKIILSRAARSARLTTHFDLDFPKQPQTEPYWCYKHSRICSPTEDALQFLARYSHDTLKRIAEFSRLRTSAAVQVFHDDSSQSSFPPINGVVTSPPYVGLIDYHEQHAYAYHLLGLHDRRDSEIGAAARGSSQKAKGRYQNDIAAVFKNALSAMPSGGRMVVVAADKAGLYEPIAHQIGVEVEHVVQRHVNRRTGRRAGEFYESVFIWRKP
jgi:DNA modification methylase